MGYIGTNMAPPRVDNKKLSKEKSKKKPTKKDSKSSSLPSTAIAVAITALIAVCVAVYYKNGSQIETKLDESSVGGNRKPAVTTKNKRTEVNADIKILPRLDGVKVGKK